MKHQTTHKPPQTPSIVQLNIYHIYLLEIQMYFLKRAFIEQNLTQKTKLKGKNDDDFIINTYLCHESGKSSVI